MSLETLAKSVSQSERLWIRGQGTKDAWRVAEVTGDCLDLTAYQGIVDYSPNDQVVAVRAGTLVDDLQRELAAYGQCLPIAESLGTIGGSIAVNLPHLLEAKCGTWRDWTLGMTLVLADGTTAKSGSHAVKSVAGYDIHKLMIGARGSLAVIAEVILRTYPLKSLPQVDPALRELARRFCAGDGGRAVAQRVLRTDFEEARRQSVGLDIEGTSTLWRSLAPDEKVRRYPSDWVLRASELPIEDPVQIRLMQRTKELFDGSAKLNAGVMGIF